MSYCFASEAAGDTLRAMKLGFYEHFACGYGTLWLLLFARSYITKSEFHLDQTSIYGMLVLALIYALIRWVQSRRGRDLIQNLRNEIDLLRGEREEMAQAVREIRNSLPPRVRISLPRASAGPSAKDPGN